MGPPYGSCLPCLPVRSDTVHVNLEIITKFDELQTQEVSTLFIYTVGKEGLSQCHFMTGLEVSKGAVHGTINTLCGNCISFIQSTTRHQK